MSLGTKRGAVPYCQRNQNVRVRNDEDYEKYMAHLMGKMIQKELSNEDIQPRWRSCEIDFH